MLIWELVCGFAGHRERCPDCRAVGRFCEATREPLALALQAIEDWRRGRRLRTRAEELRAVETESAA